MFLSAFFASQNLGMGHGLTPKSRIRVNPKFSKRDNSLIINNLFAKQINLPNIIKFEATKEKETKNCKDQ